MEDWFHSILEHLYKSYPLDHSFHNINPFLINALKVDSNIPNHLHRLSAILQILKDKQYIDGNPQPHPDEISRGNVIGVVNHGAGYTNANSLLTHTVMVRLTIDGYVYMQSREMKEKEHKSVLATQKSTRTINKWFYATLFIALCGLVVQLANLWINLHTKSTSTPPLPTQALPSKNTTVSPKGVPIKSKP